MKERYEEYCRKKTEMGEEPLSFEFWAKIFAKLKPANADKYPHYFPQLPAGVSHADVYRVLDMFQVKRSSVAHAVKKLLCSGRRGVKDEREDLVEARDSVSRAIEMLDEEGCSK